MPTGTEEEITAAARRLIQMANSHRPPQYSAATVVVTLGSKGCLLVTPDSAPPVHISAPRVEAIDTTGAGDCFIGAMAFFLGMGNTLPNALQKACHIASMSVTKRGTQTSFPTRDQVPSSFFD
ncbi:ribokinase domain protein [Pelomyxa schiedti]|nr:ribokinase domain protein [Pelomyxa schiedti]